MFQVPFMTGDFETGVPPNAQPAMPIEMGMPVMGGGQPHITFAGTITRLFAQKASHVLLHLPRLLGGHMSSVRRIRQIRKGRSGVC